MSWEKAQSKQLQPFLRTYLCISPPTISVTSSESMASDSPCLKTASSLGIRDRKVLYIGVGLLLGASMTRRGMAWHGAGSLLGQLPEDPAPRRTQRRRISGNPHVVRRNLHTRQETSSSAPAAIDGSDPGVRNTGGRTRIRE